ncbi:hypothetical protein KR038_009321 [Drosophila bunnanda]|nr:hypothetical protein KR038_009321 [Drosophila bunnanda]
MHTARSRAGLAPQRSNSNSNSSSGGRRCLQLLLLAVLLHHERAAAMSLDRLALERNELPADQFPAAEPAPAPAPAQPDVLVDDMKLTSIPSADAAADMYMLVPETVASQLEDTEHVHRNSIESDSGSEDPASAASDMLMLESDSSPALQLVELPSDITVAEQEQEQDQDQEQDHQQQLQPESIEEHVVLMKPSSSSSSGSQEAQLEQAVDSATEEAPAPAPVAANDEDQPEAEEEEPLAATTATPEEQAMDDQVPEESEVQPEQVQAAAEGTPVEESQPQEAESQPEAEQEQKREQEVESQPEEEASQPEIVAEEVQPEAEAEAKPAEETQPETESQPETQAQPEAESQPEAETQPEAQSQPEIPSGIPAEIQADQEKESESESENGTDAEAELEKISDNEVDTTEASLMETLAENIEEGLTAAMDNLVPEELAEATENKEQELQQEQETISEQEELTPVTEAAAIEEQAVSEAEPAGEEKPELISADEPEQEAEPAQEVQPEVVPAAAPEAKPEEEPKPQEEEAQAEEEIKAEEAAKPEEEAKPEAEAKPEEEAKPEAEPKPEEESHNDDEIQPEINEIKPEEPKDTIPAEIPLEIPAEIPAEVPSAIPAEIPAEIPAQAPAQLQDEVQAEPQAETEQEKEPQPMAEEPKQPEQPSLLTTIIPMVLPQPQVPSQPLQVQDSVLNYVNASFLGQQQAEAELPKTEEESPFNAHLRRYDGAQVWRIVVQTDKDKRLADELQSKYDGQLWKEVKQEVDYLLKPQVLAAAERHIRAANLSRIVLIDNLQHVIEVENPPAEKIAELQNRKGHRLTWQAYHRLEDIHGFIDYMAKTYPDICSTEVIGYSVEKRPLKILKISNGNARNPGVWIDGGMHAREWISPATVTFIANQLVEGWEDLPEHMRSINWYIHPVANPDGYEYSHTTDRLWRKNMRAHGRQCPGVDLNRNFGYKWGGKGTSASPCSQTYRGSKAFSEPETFYISKFISGFPRETFQAYLSFHSYGQYILYPWGYDYQLTQDRADLDRVARQAGTSITKSTGVKYTVGSSATTLYPAAGGSDDWAKGIAGIKYAYTIEMGDTGRYGFVLPARFIQYNGKDGYTFADTVARAIAQGRGKAVARNSSGSRRRGH